MSRRARPLSMLVVVLAVCLFAAVGYRVGQTMRSSTADAVTSWQNAAAASFPQAKERAYRSAWVHAYGLGWKAGIAAGRSAGARAGRAAAHAEAAASAVAARAIAAALAATPVKLARRSKTEKCVEVAGGLCETLGPGVTGKPCPPASVPDPEGGVVCVPRVLLQAGRIAHARSLKVFSP